MVKKRKERESSEFLDLSDKPVGKDNLPIGTPCVDSCFKPPVNSNWAHCPVCHSSFRGLSYFTSHRMGGRCLNPVVLGLTEVGGLWATPEGHEQREVLSARLKDARATKTRETKT